MEQADFVHLVRLSEHASAADSRAYRRSVAVFAALGYVWMLGCLLLAAGLLAWAVPKLLQGHALFIWIWVVLAALGLIWTCLRAMWVRITPPARVVEITSKDAPILFDALERIRKKVQGPPIHTVYLDDDFNASIRQTPRWGLLGGAVNTLTLGLPLLMALNKPRLLAVLVHEYGHLRGDHGRFAAWIYRTRQSWLRLHESFDKDLGPVAMATQSFLRWYLPRFAAKTFALARQDEYEADRIAGRLLGADVAAAALIEIEVKGAWLQQTFWHTHWCSAMSNALPVGPYAGMCDALRQAPEQEFANEALRTALASHSDVADTHPVLRDRLEALAQAPKLPAWSERSAVTLLGEGLERWIMHFDRQWCRENATAWKQHHARLQRLRERVGELSAQRSSAHASALVEEATLRLRFDPYTNVLPLYQLALQRSPGYAEALRGMATALPSSERSKKLQYLETLWSCSAEEHGWWAAQYAVQVLETPCVGLAHDATALKLWRERRKQAQEIESSVWEELGHTHFFSQITRHDLSAFELAELQADLAAMPEVARCWLVRKNLRTFGQRRAYLVFVDLPALQGEALHEQMNVLQDMLDLPGIFMLVAAGQSPTRAEIDRVAQDPVYVRAART